MSIQTPEKTNGAPIAQRTSVAIRPLRIFARDPFRNFEAMRQMMDSMFDAAAIPELRADVEPAVNLYEKDGTYTLECAVPGYKKEDIVVEARGDEVSISGAYSHEQNDEKNHYHRKEMRQASFSRTIALPQDVDPERVAAKLEHGILKIELHPTKAIKSKTIPITG
jgi:HSP20 family protein